MVEVDPGERIGAFAKSWPRTGRNLWTPDLATIAHSSFGLRRSPANRNWITSALSEMVEVGGSKVISCRFGMQGSVAQKLAPGTNDMLVPSCRVL